jgi:hypothetical protein
MKAVSLVDNLRWTEDGEIKSVGAGEKSARGVIVDLPAEEFDRLEAAGAVEKPGNSGGSSDGWPKTHDELDALAKDVEGITVTPGEGKAKSTWNDGAVKTTADKVAALQAAGVPEPSSE